MSVPYHWWNFDYCGTTKFNVANCGGELSVQITINRQIEILFSFFFTLSFVSHKLVTRSIAIQGAQAQKFN